MIGLSTRSQLQLFTSTFRQVVTAICIFLIPLVSLKATNAITHIKSLSVDDGLSSHNISCVTQDEYGYLWVGTDDGLNRYTGTNFQVFRNDPGDTLTLSDTRVTTLFATTFEGVPELWVGTRNGLNRLDLKTGLFTTYFHDLGKVGSLSHPTVTSITADGDGTIWVGTENGLNMLSIAERESGKFLKFFYARPEEVPGPHNFIRKIITGLTSGNENQIWVGTRGGLTSVKYSQNMRSLISDYDFSGEGWNASENDIRALFLQRQKNNTYLYVGNEAGDLLKLNIYDPNNGYQKIRSFDNFIRDIHIDDYKRIWVATYGGGLVRFIENETAELEMTTFLGQPDIRNSLSNSHISDLFVDMTGVIWAATDNGLNAIMEPMHGFSVLSHLPGDDNSLVGSGIRSVYEDAYGILWVGTVANGLTRVNRSTQNYQHFVHNPKDPTSLRVNSIASILEDKLGTLWVGTWEGGLSQLNGDGKTFTHFLQDPANPKSLPSNVIQGILEDREGRLWLNTGNGLSRYDRQSNSFVTYQYDPLDSNSMSSGELQSKAMYLDRYNRLWLGSYGGGLSRLDLKQTGNLDPETARFDHFQHDSQDEQSISSDIVISLAGTRQDGVDVLWVGTFNSGLTRLNYSFEGDQEKFSFKQYTEEDGLCDNVIFGIEADRYHDLWLSTGEGLARFDTETEHFMNYYVEDGLPANGFFWGASHRSPSGELFFGGTDGLVHFFPDGITGRLIFTPKISISDVKIMNSRVSDRPKDFNLANLNIDYTENLFSIEWALFDFVNPTKNTYFYRLDGLHNDWVSTGNKNSVTFSNLRGGQYIFRVKGSNYNGVQAPEEAVLNIRIRPPLTQTLVFKIISVTIIFLIIYLVIVVRTRMMSLRNQQLRESNEALSVLIKKREQAENALRQSLDEKEVLLREIYHRTKNNMTVIISLLNLQAAGVEQLELKEMFDEIKGRIYSMALVHDQLMRTKDLSVIDLNGYVRQLIANLIYSYSGVGSRISTLIRITGIDVSIDTAVPLGLVINEIITNSLKYAFPGERKGEITVIAQVRQNQLYLKITDDGIGFSRLAEDDGQKTLGMRIIYSVVEDQLDGEISLNSEDGTSYELLLKEIKIVRRV